MVIERPIGAVYIPRTSGFSTAEVPFGIAKEKLERDDKSECPMYQK